MTQMPDRMNDHNPLGRCFHCGMPIRYKDEYCTACGKMNEGWVETTQERCGHCHAHLKPDDRYCRLCGTKVGDGAYEPYQDSMQCIYGPPPAERKHICKKCGYTWTTCAMIDYEEYCPKCGGPAPYCDPEEIQSPHKDLKEAQKSRSFWQKLTGFWHK